LPERITSWNDVIAIQTAINRTYKIVNLSSLLVMYNGWGEEVKKWATPDVVRFCDEVVDGGRRPDPARFNARIVVREAAGTIWGVE
jgi:hypothetical protein